MYYELWANEVAIFPRSNFNPETRSYDPGYKPEFRQFQLRKGHQQFICYGALVDYHLKDGGVTFDLQVCHDNGVTGSVIYFPTITLAYPGSMVGPSTPAALSRLKQTHLTSIHFEIFENPGELANTVLQVSNPVKNLVTEIVWKKVAEPTPS